MKIFVDADSCPPQIRDIICRAAVRKEIQTVFAANVKLKLPESEFIEMVVVDKGEGVADDYIVENCTPGDLAVTRDIPLAARLIDQNIIVINDRGNLFTTENIRERLSVRDLMKDFREAGIMPERESSFSNKEVGKFANCFDRELTKLLKAGT